MTRVVKSIVNSIREKGLVGFFTHLKDQGYLRCLPDGNLLQTKIHNIGARLVGVDKFGNKYYEKLENCQYGRHRWVEYAEKSRYNASQVPPEWHGWLHFITDHTGDELLLLKPKRYGVEHKENLTGEGEQYIYHSKGHALNPGQRNWTRIKNTMEGSSTLLRASLNDIEELKAECLALRNRIEKKVTYLQELKEQYVGLENLIQRNEQLYSSGNAPNGGVSLPFILMQTGPHATVEVEISEDMQLVHFDFNSTAFELHDDNYVLKAMKFCERPQIYTITLNLTDGGDGSSMSGGLYDAQVPNLVLNPPVRPPSSPPLPGILKARVKNEH